jgi:putative ABC transport system permease protein
MIVANLLHRPVRSVVSIVAVAVEVTLILVIVGLSLGMLNDVSQRTAGTGADIIVQPPGSSFLTGLSGAPVSIKVADVLRKLPHVSAVSPVVWNLSTAGSVELIYGIDLKSFEALGGPLHYLSGGPFTGPDQVIVDDYAAASEHVTAGDTVRILNHAFKVAGVVEHGRGARKFVPIATLQDLIGAEGKASVFYVKADGPADINAVAQEIHQVEGMQQYKVLSMREYLSMMTAANLPGMQQFIQVVIGVALVIGFIVIFQAMYTAVVERTREIGILKSMGASKLYVVNVILRETLLLAIVGTIVGIGISYLTKDAIRSRFPTLPVEIQAPWILYATLIALGGAILGAVYPAYKAAQKDPIDALAYE